MKAFTKIISVLLVACMLMSLVACGTQAPESTEATETTGAPTTDASATDATETSTPTETKPVLLAVSFGSSYNETRDVTIGAVEAALQAAYPEYEVRRAFTSQIVIDILEEREKMEIDNVIEAMDRLVADGVKEVVVQPTHVMPGFEYDDVMAEIADYADKFDSMKVGDPLLASDDDYDALVASLLEETAEYNAEGTAIVFMGHGTHHEANETYSRLQKRLNAAGAANYFIGTVEAEPSLDTVLAAVQETEATKVVLLPLMIVAGDHANNDMAGDEEDSWKTAFANAGYEVECVLKGLGQYGGVQNILIAHAGKAIEGQRKVLLAVSFGTSYNETRALTIDAVEDALQAAYPEYEVRRAFTAQTVIDILAERDGYDIDNVEEAMDRLIADGVKEVVVQPTHVMTGFEYDDVVKAVSKYEGKFDSLKISTPVVTTDADYDALVASLIAETAAYNVEGTAIVFMGHGTHHEANATYANLQQKLIDAGYANYFIGTVEATPSLDDVLAAVQATDATKVVLLPLMIVAGDHASNDMAGDEEGSWKDTFTKAGYEVECVLNGLGQYEGVQQILIDHAAATIAG